MKIVVGCNFPPGAAECFEECFRGIPDVEIILDKATILQKTDMEVLVCRGVPLTRELFERNPGLKMIQKWGTGLDNVDMEAAKEHGILICNMPGVNAYTVAELTVMLMLATYRNLLWHNRRMTQGIWTKSERIDESFCLKDKVVGIVGGGNIGRLVAHYVQAFGAKTVYYDVFRLSEQREKENGLTYLPLDELLGSADIVTLHVPLLDSTKNMIGKEQLAKMKQTAILINAARGGLVQEDALLEALDDGIILGAGLDCIVHEGDKLNINDPILHNERITLTPHIGGCSADLTCEMARQMAKNALRFVFGQDVLWKAE